MVRWLAADLSDCLRHDFVCNVLRRSLVAIELHGVVRSALSQGAQIRRIAEHLGQRYSTTDHLGIAAGVHSLDTTASRVQVSHDLAHVFLGRHDFDRHHRLEQLQLSPTRRISPSHRASDLEGDF